jgi:hypothetical protein
VSSSSTTSTDGPSDVLSMMSMLFSLHYCYP